MVGLDDFPVELIEKICCYLRDLKWSLNPDRADPRALEGLKGLASTAWRYYRIALPYLWWNNNFSDDKISYVCEHRSFFLNESLADLVHSAEIRAWQGLRNPFVVRRGEIRVDLARIGPLSYIEGDAKWLDRYSDKILPPDLEDARQSIASADQEPWSMLRGLVYLLTRLRNVEKMKLIVYWDMEDQPFIWDRLKGKDYFLPALKEISIYPPCSEGAFDFSAVYSFVSCTRIRKLTLTRCCGSDMLRVKMKLPSLRELRILRSAIVDRDLFVLVAKCFPNLELLRYEKNSDLLLPHTATAEDISHYISLYSKTLPKTLRTLILRVSWVRDEEEDEDAKAIYTLANCTELEHLVLGLDDLTDEIYVSGQNEEEFHPSDGGLKPFVHKLPRSLKSLYIANAESYLYRGLVELVQKAHEFPNLKNVTVDEELESDLETLFKNVGIRYREVYAPKYRSDLEEVAKMYQDWM